MIKNLKSKLIICLFLLVTVFSVTSSCFALNTEFVNCPYSIEEFVAAQTWVDVSSYNKVYGYYDSSTGTYSIKFFDKDFSYGVVNSSSQIYVYDSNGTRIKSIKNCASFKTTSNWGCDTEWSTSKDYVYDETTLSTRYLTNLTNFPIYDSNMNLLYNPVSLSVDVTHEFQSDTSAKVNFVINNAPDGAILKYSLTGVEVSTDLTAPLQLKNPVTYSPGVTNLVVKPNTKVYWALYDTDGSCLLSDVYQVPEYDSVIENADKSIEYSITYNEDNSLATLTVNVVNGEFSDKLYYTENGMVSNDYAGKQLFPASRSLQIDHNCNMHIILYDPFDNLITAKYVTINKIGSIPEQNFKVDVTTGDKTVYIRPRLYNVLQSSFYSIEYDVILDNFSSSKDIELHQDGVYVGKVTDTSQTYTCGSDSELKFYQNIGTSNITVTFRIINAETGVTCITRTVSFKIGLDDESTGVTDSTTNGVTDNSFITSGTDSNYSGVANMGIDDYYNMVNTNNTAWSFLKVILNSLPNWITLPLSLLIFGVVTITLYRFIRGA